MSSVLAEDDRALLRRVAEVAVDLGLDYIQLSDATHMSREWARQFLSGWRPDAINRPTRGKLRQFTQSAVSIGFVREAPPEPYSDELGRLVRDLRDAERRAKELVREISALSRRLEDAVSRPVDPAAVLGVHAARGQAATKGAAKKG